ncbi:MAG: type III pantothenate kinase [Candidatus Krumholzibacteriota bacterium]|nr:type III pantothenate kinase [Candidatus Krumholzibacteriota bacterium]
MSRVLALDRGNYSLKAALFSSGSIVERWDSAPGSSAELLEKILDDAAPEGIVYSSVVPEWKRLLLKAAGGRRPVVLLEAGYDSDLPFELLLDDRSSVGSDRISAAAGAVSEGYSEAVIVDAGTAVTVDLLSSSGFEGGSIFPGSGLLLSSLGKGTAALPDLAPGGGLFNPPFRNTADAMISGSTWGLIGAVKELVQRTIESSSGRPEVILTGGSAGLLKPHIGFDAKVIPDLVFKGLFWIFTHNPGGS